jgi:hypothetical protein
MPEAVSTLSLLVGYASINAFSRQSSAVSFEAQVIREAAHEVVQHAERSESLFGIKSEAISKLWTMFDECSEADWDGNGSEPLKGVAAGAVEAFIRALPVRMPMPEMAPEPDGAVSLDWVESRYRRFSISFGGNDRLAYAWLDGSDKGHAVARFDGAKIPPRILEGIQSIMNHADATIRTC